MLGSIILIVLGILLLLNNLYPDIYRFSRMWPVVLIVIGFVKLAEYFQVRKVKVEERLEGPLEGPMDEFDETGRP